MRTMCAETRRLSRKMRLKEFFRFTQFNEAVREQSMSFQLKCMGCLKVRKVSADIGNRVIICKTCTGLLVPISDELPVDEMGTVDLSGRRVSVGCRSCSALVDIPKGVGYGSELKCPRCHNKAPVPTPRLQYPIATPISSNMQYSSSLRSENTHSSDASVTSSRTVPVVPGQIDPPIVTSELVAPPIAQQVQFGTNSEPLLAASPSLPSTPTTSSFPTSFESTTAQGIQSSSANIDSLRSVDLWQSWRTGKLRLPNYLVKGRGRQLEAIAERFVAAINRESLSGVTVAIAAEQVNARDISRPLRVLSYQGPLHLNATDVFFRSEGSDLFVKFQSTQRTWITYLRLVIYAIAFLGLYLGLLLCYLNLWGARNSWAMDYVNKYSSTQYVTRGGDSRAPFFLSTILNGYYEIDCEKLANATSGASSITFLDLELRGFTDLGQYRQGSSIAFVDGRLIIKYAPDIPFASIFEIDEGVVESTADFYLPWTSTELFFADPKLAMYSLGGPSMILAMFIGGALYFLPMTVLRVPCRMLGWPTYEEFMNMSNSRNAWVERVLSDTLMEEFGVLEQDRFNVMSQ